MVPSLCEFSIPYSKLNYWGFVTLISNRQHLQAAFIASVTQAIYLFPLGTPHYCTTPRDAMHLVSKEQLPTNLIAISGNI